MESRAYKWYCDRVWRQPQKKMSLITFTLGTVVPFYPRFWFARFQLPMANCIPKILNEKFQKWTVPRFLNCTAFWAAPSHSSPPGIPSHRHHHGLMVKGHGKHMIWGIIRRPIAAYVIHFVSSHHIGILSSHIILKRRMSTRSYFEKDHLHITFIMEYCLNGSLYYCCC